MNSLVSTFVVLWVKTIRKLGFVFNTIPLLLCIKLHENPQNRTFDFQLVVFFVGCLAAYAQASVWGLGATLVGPSNPGALVQGPSAQAALVGPDGSNIVAAGQAGAIAASPIPGGKTGGKKRAKKKTDGFFAGVVSAGVAPGAIAVGHGGLLGGGLLLG